MGLREVKPVGAERVTIRRWDSSKSKQCVFWAPAGLFNVRVSVFCEGSGQRLNFESLRKGGNVEFPKRADASSDTQCTSRGGLAYKHA